MTEVTGPAASKTSSVLVLGESGAGKTHFAVQLLGRLNHGSGRLMTDGAAADLSPFEEGLRQLSHGLAAAHTPAGQFRQSVLPLKDRETGARLDVVWPDYAGEQVLGIIETRDMPADWRARAARADAWILMIRLQHIRMPDDMLSRPADMPLLSADAEGEDDPAPFRWSDQARLVELLQLLLSARGVGTARVLSEPRLVVLLSCWDEVEPCDLQPIAATDKCLPSATTRPGEALATKAPLLAHFIEANWSANAHAVYGLSALGRALLPDQQDEEFVDKGPEEFGYVVCPDGSVTSDLTLPLIAAAAAVRGPAPPR